MRRALLLPGVLLQAAACAHTTVPAVSAPASRPSCHAAIVAGEPYTSEADESPTEGAPSILWQRASSTPADGCDGVGPAVIVKGPAPAAAGSLIVVAWNMHVGGGDLPALLSSLGLEERDDPARPALVLLLQEVFRSGEAVPPLRHGAGAAGGIAGHPGTGERKDIVQLARELGLWAVYVPSMRNGDGAEDRGNAIVSTLPLGSIEAIELPGGRQRRVAVAADVLGRMPDGAPWRIRVASIHLESRTHARRLWIFARGVRATQARAAVEAMEPAAAAILGGDFNSWSGFDETAYRETAAHFPDTRVTDPRPTFAFRRRLDHLFFRLPEGWRARFERLDDRFGSDHHPLAAVVDVNVRTAPD